MNKIRIAILFIIVLFVGSCLAQDRWELNHPGQGTNSYDPLSCSFANANTGWLLYEYTTSTNNREFTAFRTTNKGYGWVKQPDITTTFPGAFWAEITCLDEHTCWLFSTDDDGSDILTLYMTRTTDGINWTALSSTDMFDLSLPFARFADANTGFLFQRATTSGKLYRTQNGGANWNSPVFTVTNCAFYDLRVSPSNNNVIYLGGVVYQQGAYLPYLAISTDKGLHFNAAFPSGFDVSDGGIVNISVTSNSDGSDNVKVVTASKLWQYMNNGLQQVGGTLPGESPYTRTEFGDPNNGFLYYLPTGGSNYNYVATSTNQGNNWNNELTLTNSSFGYSVDLVRTNAFGQVMFLPESGGQLYTRKLKYSFNVNADWHSTSGWPYPTQMNFNDLDGTNGHTFNNGDNNIYFRGGTAWESMPPGYHFCTSANGNDTVAQFYYWGGNSNAALWNPDDHTGGSPNEFYNVYDGQVNADYKTKLVTINSGAMSPSPQVKCIEDTNHVMNLVYESMGGGIFYTRINQGIGQNQGNFKTEEFVSAQNSYAGFGNTNPYISEIKPHTAPGDIVPPEANVVIVWEQRSGSTINIIGAWRNAVGPYYQWTTRTLGTVQNAPSNFNCYPKMFEVFQNHEGEYLEWMVLTYLQPEANGNKSIQGSYGTQEGIGGAITPLVLAGNITDYSVAFAYDDASAIHMHIAYVENNVINYRHREYAFQGGWNSSYTYYDWPVSNGDGCGSGAQRFSPDITVANYSNNPANPNMQPVVTYQAQYQINVITPNNDAVMTTRYPIVVNERISNQNWSSAFILYNTTTPQQNPQIDGSKTDDSYLLNYFRSPSTYYQQATKWHGSFVSGDVCQPGSFSGIDAKLIRGELVGHSEGVDTLLTLSSQSNGTFQFGRQPFSVGLPMNGGFDGVSGNVSVSNTEYSFNLGSVMVNGNDVQFNEGMDSVITSIDQLNGNLTSSPFLLNNNDTLILGRDAFYLAPDSTNTFTSVQYWVDLVSNTTGMVQQNLIYDSVSVNDTIYSDYLDGFVITNIKGGSDSFYVQLTIDTTLVSVAPPTGGLLGGAGGGTGLWKSQGKKIFWHDGRKEKPKDVIPTVFNLYQNYPNPFNPSAVIKYDVPQDVNVTIKVYDLIGREVTRLVNNEFKKAGSYEVTWNANNYASGVYFYRMEAGKYVSTKKMVLLK